MLFQTGGCGSPRAERSGFLSRMLVDVVDGYCPDSYDFGIQPAP